MSVFIHSEYANISFLLQKYYAPVPFQSIFAPEIALYDDQQKKYPGKSDANPIYG